MFKKFCPRLHIIAIHQLNTDISVYDVKECNPMTTHLLSIERVDWLKLYDMFNARDAQSWQR